MTHPYTWRPSICSWRDPVKGARPCMKDAQDGLCREHRIRSENAAARVLATLMTLRERPDVSRFYPKARQCEG